ncbi:MAG: Cys-tRNA(Pro) deacylase [Methylibium sp.]|uniref:Cys-tRNA(Pro) deacylase n=1 Tax=Methylibium sp. TaxID=2067992 RepID=UPI0017F3C716|nr:Cys-tRNA(Pro) deacylase [Methylibium sp.]MBA3596579.1 Cys-tRNA(Pro) deacylase [Methylibium sp.]
MRTEVDGRAGTPATVFLKHAKLSFTEHSYDYVERGGTAESARQLGVDEHAVVKTLVMQDENARPLIVLMHGDRQVGLKALAREIDCKRVAPCEPEAAQRHSGYLVGGTSPFGTKKAIPVFVEASVMELQLIYINGGRRGFLVGVEPRAALALVNARSVHCAQ